MIEIYWNCCREALHLYGSLKVCICEIMSLRDGNYGARIRVMDASF